MNDQRSQGFNGFAIAALVLGIVAIFPLAIIFGCIALSQIKDSRERGRGLAISGLAGAAIWMVLITVGIVLVVDRFVGRDDSGRIDHAGLIQEEDLVPGDCVDDPVEDGLLDGVPCEDRHSSEVYARFRLEGSDFPGAANVRRRANAGCLHRFEAKYGVPGDESEVDLGYFSPDGIDWTFGDRDVICFVNYYGKQRGKFKLGKQRRSQETI